jgi:hypothetical protein
VGTGGDAGPGPGRRTRRWGPHVDVEGVPRRRTEQSIWGGMNPRPSRFGGTPTVRCHRTVGVLCHRSPFVVTEVRRSADSCQRSSAEGTPRGDGRPRRAASSPAAYSLPSWVNRRSRCRRCGSSGDGHRCPRARPLHEKRIRQYTRAGDTPGFVGDPGLPSQKIHDPEVATTFPHTLSGRNLGSSARCLPQDLRGTVP